MKRWLLAFVLLPAVALGQTGPTAMPTATNGFGTLSVSTSSVALSTLTVGPNSLAWHMPLNGTLYVSNSINSAGNLYVCPFGGACTAAAGIPLSPGQAYGFNLGGTNTSPTVIADTTATAVAQW
jgi:hypothetical protein